MPAGAARSGARPTAAAAGVVSRSHGYGASFAGPRRGWSLTPGRAGAGWRLLSTRDGGRRWQVVPGFACARGAGAFAARASRRDGWALCVGQGATDMAARTLYRTRDAGRSWQRVAPSRIRVGIPTGFAMDASGRGLVMQDRGTVLLSRDGGRRWHGLDRVVASGPANAGVQMGLSGQFLGPRRVVLLHQYGKRDVLSVSHDGGRSWRPRHSWPSQLAG